LEQTLESVLANRPRRCEVVVVLARAYDDPYHLGDEVRYVSARSCAGLAESINLGIRECRAPIVHLLACGATVDEGWTAGPLEDLRDRRLGSVAPLVLDERDPTQIVSAGMEYHPGGVRRLLGRGLPAARAAELATSILGPTAQAAFYRRGAALANEGLFDVSLGDGLADADLALRLRQAGNQARFEPTSIVYDAPAAATRPSFVAARQAERIFWRHAPTLGLARSIALHGLVVAGELRRGLPHPSALTQLAGRMVGSCDWGNHQRQRHRWALPPAEGGERRSSELDEHTATVASRIDPSHAKVDASNCRTLGQRSQSV
jgi:hypothetical protein